MNKHFHLAGLLLCFCWAFTSCLDSDDPKSEATLSYAATCSGITYTDSTDLAYESLIVKALEEEGIVGAKSQFEETASVNYNSMNAVYTLCNQQAAKTYQSKLEAVTLSQIQDRIGTEPSLHEMTVHLALYNSVTLPPIESFSLTLR